MDAHTLRRTQGLPDIGFADRGDAVAPGFQDEIPGAGPRFDQSVVFQLAAGLQRGGQADVMGPHQGTNGRHALGGSEHAGLDGAPVVIGQA
ncbi:hypothetical protein D3C72_2182440 [compost metagenome]